MNALKTVYSSRFRVRLIICILNTIYWLLFSTISEKNQGGLYMESPRQRGLKASGLQRRQSGSETHEHQTNQ
ncbi:hypothetical protein ACNKHR_25480 [Shigella flexneri]